LGFEAALCCNQPFLQNQRMVGSGQMHESPGEGERQFPALRMTSSVATRATSFSCSLLLRHSNACSQTASAALNRMAPVPPPATSPPNSGSAHQVGRDPGVRLAWKTTGSQYVEISARSTGHTVRHDLCQHVRRPNVIARRRVKNPLLEGRLQRRLWVEPHRCPKPPRAAGT